MHCRIPSTAPAPWLYQPLTWYDSLEGTGAQRVLDTVGSIGYQATASAADNLLRQAVATATVGSTGLVGDAVKKVTKIVSSGLGGLTSFVNSFEASRNSGATAGQAFPQCVFSHWQAFNGGDPLQEGTKGNEMVKSIRNRKGLAPEVPTADRFLDKL